METLGSPRNSRHGISGDGEDGWLDAYHQELVQRVLDKDTDESRRELAERFIAELTDDIDALRADQADLGTEQQMNAIRSTGWTGWGGFFILTSWVIVLIDSLVWFAGGAQVLSIL